MKPTPSNWTRFSSCIFYQDPAKAIDWLCRAFGFEVRLKVEGDGGTIVHSELVFGDGLVMISDESSPKAPHHKSPRSIGGANTQALMVYVDDAAAHLKRAEAAGAKITAKLDTHDYGDEYWSDRGYECEDPEGHRWWFFERLRDPSSTKPTGTTVSK